MWVQEGMEYTVDQIWVTHQVVEKVAEYQTPVYLCVLTCPRHMIQCIVQHW